LIEAGKPFQIAGTAGLDGSHPSARDKEAASKRRWVAWHTSLRMWDHSADDKKAVIRLRVARSDDEARPLLGSRQPYPFQVAALLSYQVNLCPMRDGSGCRGSKKNRIEALPEAILR
jgi:hypothetical protein